MVTLESPIYFLKIWAYANLYFVLYFRPFKITILLQMEKSLDDALGIRTRGCRLIATNGAMGVPYKIL